jgi:hypothetical protein
MEGKVCHLVMMFANQSFGIYLTDLTLSDFVMENRRKSVAT